MKKEHFYDKAWECFKFEDFEKALINIDLAIEEDPLNPKLYILRFEILQSKHKFSKNTAVFLEVDKDIILLLDSNSTDIQNKFVEQSITDQGTNTTKIQSELRRLKINPVRSFVYERRRHLYSLLGDYQKQVEAIQDAIKNAGETRDQDYLELGQAYYHLGDYDKAIENLTHYLGPPRGPRIFPLAQCYFKKKYFESAKDHLLKSIERLTLRFGDGEVAKVEITECERYLRIVQYELRKMETNSSSIESNVPYIKYSARRSHFKVSTPSLPETMAIPLKSLCFGETLGEGGFGKVFAGHLVQESFPNTNFPVAIKQFKDVHNSKKTMEDFEREAKLLSTLNSPDIVRLIGVLFEEPPSLVMEFMLNQALNTFLKTQPRESILWSVRIQFAYNIASALNYLHTRNPVVIHCDIKSPNILLDQYYQAKLADFGVAIEVEKNPLWPNLPTKASVEAHGTVKWMPPELFEKGSANSTASDIYSFGMLMFEICTHDYPFKDYSRKDRDITISKIRLGELDAYPTDTPDPYKKLGQCCTAFKSYNRPNASQVLNYLRFFKSNSIFKREIGPNPFQSDDPAELFKNPGDYFC